MTEQQGPRTETVSVTDARKHFSETLDRVYRGESRVVVERSGIAVGALVSPRDLDVLERDDSKRREALVALQDIQGAFADVPDDEFQRELEKAIREIKAENRARREAERAVRT